MKALQIIVLLGAGLCGGCDPGGSASTANPRTGRTADPGYSLKDAEITETDATGQARYTVRAAHAQQNPGSGEIALEHIRMQMRDQRGGEWNLDANAGRMPEDAATVALFGDVVLSGAVGARQDPINVRTEKLDVDTRTERISTDALVTIAVTGGELLARGLKADLKNRRVQLESDVHGRFHP